MMIIIIRYYPHNDGCMFLCPLGDQLDLIAPKSFLLGGLGDDCARNWLWYVCMKTVLGGF